MRSLALLLLLTVLQGADALPPPADDLTALAAAVAEHPDDPAFYDAYGAALRRAERYAEATSALSQAVTLGPTADRHHALGMVLARQDRHREAFAAYAAALRLDPGHQPALLAAGVILEAADRREEAIRLYRSAVQADATLLAAWFALGRCHQEQGEWDLAEQAYAAVLGIDHGHLQARARLIQVYQAAGLRDRRDNAIARFYRLRSMAAPDEPLRRVTRFLRERTALGGGHLTVEEHFNPLHGPLWLFRYESIDHGLTEFTLRQTLDGWTLSRGAEPLGAGSGLPRYDEIREQVCAALGLTG